MALHPGDFCLQKLNPLLQLIDRQWVQILLGEQRLGALRAS
jgi:hypothetical protein